MIGRPRGRVLVVALAVGLLGSACGQSTPTSPRRPVIGFIFVGESDDLGYNQAAWEGHEAVARAFPSHDVIGVEGVPETEEAVRALEELIDRGAEMLFATSFGHLDAAFDVARRHPDVVVLHQGGLEPQPGLPNFGTYFGTHAEAVYAAGIAAGSDSTAGRLGFVAAFPIPATYNNVNAFLLGARQSNPTATVDVMFTESWCEPDAQERAAAELLARGVDVIAQHQDCTRTVLEAAEEAGVAAVGYHADGSEIAPTSWLTGAIWTWEDLYVDLVRTVVDGAFVGSPYDGDFRGTLADGNDPVTIAEAGTRVGPETRTRMAAALESFASGDRAVFTGPLTDTGGLLRVPAGERLKPDEVDMMDWFLEGVTVVDRA